MSMQHYKSAILGCGPRAAAHIEAYEGLDEITLNAACDKRRERLDEYGKKYRIPRLYEDLEKMLAQEKPDVLHIVTPPVIRMRWTCSAFSGAGVAMSRPRSAMRRPARNSAASGQRKGPPKKKPSLPHCASQPV